MNSASKNSQGGKRKVALIGPILGDTGIGSVVKTILNCEIFKDEYEIAVFNSSNSKDSNSITNLIVFLKSIFFYLMSLFEGKIELAHIHTSYGRSFYRKTVFVLLSSLFRVKVILHFHTGRFDDFFMQSSGLRKKVIELALAKSAAVAVLCNDWKEKIEKIFASKNVYVINNPLPFNTEQVESVSQKTDLNYVNVLFVGFLIKKKGIYDIIEIAEKFSGSPLSPRFVVCGKGTEERKFLKRIKDRDLQNIEYLGWVSGRKKTEIYQNCDIFLLPSYYEGMPMVLLEGMGFGMPIVASKVGGIPEIVNDGENGYLLEPGDVDGFEKKIKLLISNPTLRIRLGSNSRMMADRFKKEIISEEWHRLYRGLLQ
jgi:glycosyltransferase involved in cell wall biosynthesis